MPAFLIVMEVDRARELALGLDAGRIGGDEGLTGIAGRERPQRRQDRRRRMAAERVAAIVEIERVRRRAVDERSVRVTTAVVSSLAPASVTPTVSRMPCLAVATASPGSASNETSAIRSASARSSMCYPCFAGRRTVDSTAHPV
jgi:hypothetical protein